MSTVKSKKLQVGTDASASNNFTIYQPSTPDGTLRIGVGNADSPTEVARFDATGMISGGATPDALSTATGSAPSYSARAWVNFNGQGTIAIRASGNVSSLVDNGTGLYRVNFTTAMPDTDYAISGAGQYDTSGNANTPIIGLPRTTTSQGTGYVDISSAVPNSSNYDCLKVLVIVHR
jgi:hypothetical protein